jgi:hypothetical protein
LARADATEAVPGKADGCECVGCAVQVLTGVMVFVARDSSVQIAVGCLVNFAVLIANIALRPMADPVVRLTRLILTLLSPTPLKPRAPSSA